MDTIYAPPDGYLLDPESGLYYSSAMGTDPETGAPAQWVTWFDANSGEYRQVCYPVEEQHHIEVEEQGHIESENAAAPAAEFAAEPNRIEPGSDATLEAGLNQRGPDSEAMPAAAPAGETEAGQVPTGETETGQVPTGETAAVQETPEWPESAVPVPEGFVYDQNIGMYYIVTPGNSLETGEYGQWVTYLDPGAGVYQQHFFPPRHE